jgi:hypothetical protein
MPEVVSTANSITSATTPWGIARDIALWVDNFTYDHRWRDYYTNLPTDPPTTEYELREYRKIYVREILRTKIGVCAQFARIQHLLCLAKGVSPDDVAIGTLPNHEYAAAKYCAQWFGLDTARWDIGEMDLLSNYIFQPKTTMYSTTWVKFYTRLDLGYKVDESDYSRVGAPFVEFTPNSPSREALTVNVSFDGYEGMKYQYEVYGIITNDNVIKINIINDYGGPIPRGIASYKITAFVVPLSLSSDEPRFTSGTFDVRVNFKDVGDAASTQIGEGTFSLEIPMPH